METKKKRDITNAHSTLNSKKKKKVNTKKLVINLVAIFFFAYFCYTMIWQQVVISSKSDEIDALNEKITAAEQQNDKLEKELENIDDPEYLEKVAREKLGLVRPNERVFVDANQSKSNQSD